jgi:DNA end-binding protein Ku
MRKIGTLTISIGLVQIPMGINSFLDYQGISFKQLCPTCDGLVQYKRFCSKCNQEVEYHTLKSGFEIGNDIVVVEKEVFKTLESYPTKILAIIPTNSEYEFVTEKCYLLSPLKENPKQYFLLLNLLSSEGKSLVVEFVMRKKIHLAVVKVVEFDGVKFLMLKEVLYADKIKSVEPITEEKPTEEELKLGKELFELISQRIENKNYKEITDKRVELLQNVLSGKTKIEKPNPLTYTSIEQLKKSVESLKVQTPPINAKKSKKVKTNES